MRCRRPVIRACVVSIVPFALFAAGCSGGGSSPGVADLAASSTTTAATTTTPSDPGAGEKGPPVGPGEQFRLAMNVGTADGAKFPPACASTASRTSPIPTARA